MVSGIVSYATSEYIQVRVSSIANFLADALGKGSDGGVHVHLLKRSEDSIFAIKLKALQRCLAQMRPGRGALGEAATCVVPKLYGLQGDRQEKVGDETVHTSSSFFNPCMDTSQHAAVARCDQARSVTLIHGPPGTGKTTTLAAAVLSSLVASPSRRVLVTAPSHAACDAATLALLKHWPVHLLGEPHEGLLVSTYVLADVRTRNAGVVVSFTNHD